MDTLSNNVGSNAMSKRKAASLPNDTVEYLKAWIMSPDHIHHPYPTEAEKVKIMEDTGIEMKQLTNWFVNNRKRFWKPRVEARMKEQRTNVASVAVLEATQLPSLVSPRSSRKATTVEERGPLPTMEIPVKPAVVVTPQRAGKMPSPKPILHATFFPLVRTISEQNSLVALTELVVVSSDDESEAATGCQSSVESATDAMFKTESINVHILRPTDGSTKPQLMDVSISNTIPSERILRTFENCPVTYSCSDVAKTLSRRDAEIVRVKKSFLSVYYAELLAASVSGPPTEGSKRSAPHVVAPDDIHAPLTPRAKYRRMSVELWKEACQTANHVYDQELPSLEEATQLFGYTSS